MTDDIQTRHRAGRDETEVAAPRRGPLVGGLIALTVALVAMQVASATVIPPVAACAVIFAVLAVMIGRGAGRLAQLGAAMIASILVVASLPAATEDLSHPETFAGFTPMLAAVLAALIVVVSALVGHRSRASNTVRATGFGCCAVFAVATIGSAVATSALDDDLRRDGDVPVAARDITFPDEIDLPPGRSVLFVDNDDVVRHTLLIDGSDVNVEVPGTTSRRVTVDLTPGTYRYYCDVPGHENMEGVIVVG